MADGNWQHIYQIIQYRNRRSFNRIAQSGSVVIGLGLAGLALLLLLARSEAARTQLLPCTAGLVLTIGVSALFVVFHWTALWRNPLIVIGYVTDKQQERVGTGDIRHYLIVNIVEAFTIDAQGQPHPQRASARRAIAVDGPLYRRTPDKEDIVLVCSPQWIAYGRLDDLLYSLAPFD